MQPIHTQTARTLVIPRGTLIDVSAFYGTIDSPILVTGSDVIGGELCNVMTTLIGDDTMNPTYGCNLPRRVFEPVTADLEALCLQDVYFAAREWVNQVTVDLAQTLVFASGSNRLIGVGIAYLYAGSSWLLPVDLQGLKGDLQP